MHRSSLLLFALLITACSKKESAPASDRPAAKPDLAPVAAADKPAAPPASKGGCSYITEAEASVVIGQPAKYRSNDGGSNCVVDAVDESFSVDFEIKLDNTDAYDYLAKEGSEPLPGLGDKAVISKGATLVIQLAAVKGKASLGLAASTTKGDPRPRAKAFAEKLLSGF